MKRKAPYGEPEFEMIKLSDEDILTISGGGEEETTMPDDGDHGMGFIPF